MTSRQGWLRTAAAFSLAFCGVPLTASAPANAQARPMTALHRDVPTLAQPLPGTSMRADQVNGARWEKAWTNLMNDVEQSFTPSLPKLLAVEVDLVVGNAGPDEDELTLTVLDSNGRTLAIVTEPVAITGCEHKMFVLPKHGLVVKPGQTYWLRLKGGTLFWLEICRRWI